MNTMEVIVSLVFVISDVVAAVFYFWSAFKTTIKMIIFIVDVIVVPFSAIIEIPISIWGVISIMVSTAKCYIKHKLSCLSL